MVSKDGIQIDPLNIAAILSVPTPNNIFELQSLQRKVKNFSHFVCNFAEKTHDYMCLLKKDTPFFWDDQAQRAFDNIKHTLTHSPVIYHPDYSKDFLLYVASSTTTIIDKDNFRGEFQPSGLFFHVFLPKNICHFAFFESLFCPIFMG